MQRHRPALGKTGQHDAFSRDAALLFPFQQSVNRGCRGLHTDLILLAWQIEAEDVVPGAHAHAAVQSHRADRRVGKDKACAQRRRQVQFRHDRFEIMGIGAQAVHPDNAGMDRTLRFDLDRA